MALGSQAYAQGPPPPGEPPAEAPLVEPERSPDAVVLRFARIDALLGAEGEAHTLWVYGDGRVLVHRPGYLKSPGNESYLLGPSELDGLLQSLVGDGLLELDADDLRRRVRGRRARGPLFVRSDPPTVELELALARYRPAGSGAPAGPIRKALRWRDLAGDARRHPDLVELQGLDAARARLAALLARRGAPAP